MRLWWVLVVVGVLASAEPLWACATCACDDPALTGVSTARPTAGRIRSGVVMGFAAQRRADGFESMTVSRTALQLDWSINDRVAMDASASVLAGVREQHAWRSVDAGLGDADVGLRMVLVRDRAFGARQFAGLRLGMQLPTGMLGRDARGERLDPGVWAPHVGAFASVVHLPFVLQSQASLRTPLPEDVAGWHLRRGIAAVLRVRAQLQPHPRAGVFALGQVTAVADDTANGKPVLHSGGVLLALGAGVAFAITPDLLSETTVVAAMFDTRNDRAVAQATTSLTLDWGRR